MYGVCMSPTALTAVDRVGQSRRAKSATGLSGVQRQPTSRSPFGPASWTEMSIELEPSRAHAGIPSSTMWNVCAESRFPDPFDSHAPFEPIEPEREQITSASLAVKYQRSVYKRMYH